MGVVGYVPSINNATFKASNVTESIVCKSPNVYVSIHGLIIRRNPHIYICMKLYEFFRITKQANNKEKTVLIKLQMYPYFVAVNINCSLTDHYNFVNC